MIPPLRPAELWETKTSSSFPRPCDSFCRNFLSVGQFFLRGGVVCTIVTLHNTGRRRLPNTSYSVFHRPPQFSPTLILAIGRGGGWGGGKSFFLPAELWYTTYRDEHFPCCVCVGMQSGSVRRQSEKGAPSDVFVRLSRPI